MLDIVLIITREVFMKNSPHKRKHLQHKAVRAANQIFPQPSKKSTPLIKMVRNFLKPINTAVCENVLNMYKKHLEKARLHKTMHDSKRSTPGQIDGISSIKMEKNPNKISGHWKSKDMEKTKQNARKMLKQSHHHYKKAA